MPSPLLRPHLEAPITFESLKFLGAYRHQFACVNWRTMLYKHSQNNYQKKKNQKKTNKTRTTPISLPHIARCPHACRALAGVDGTWSFQSVVRPRRQHTTQLPLLSDGVAPATASRLVPSRVTASLSPSGDAPPPNNLHAILAAARGACEREAKEEVGAHSCYEGRRLCGQCYHDTVVGGALWIGTQHAAHIHRLRRHLMFVIVVVDVADFLHRPGRVQVESLDHIT